MVAIASGLVNVDGLGESLAKHSRAPGRPWVEVGAKGKTLFTPHAQPNASARCRPITCNGPAVMRPRRWASRASMVAIFAVRTTEATGRPAMPRSSTATSPGQPRFSALVIITTQSRP